MNGHIQRIQITIEPWVYDGHPPDHMEIRTKVIVDNQELNTRDCIYTNQLDSVLDQLLAYASRRIHALWTKDKEKT